MIAIPAETSDRPSFFSSEYVYPAEIGLASKKLTLWSHSVARPSLVGPLLHHVQTILRDLTVTADDQEMMQTLVSKAIRISAIAGSDLTMDRSIEAASLAVLEEALKKLPVQGFLDTATEAMKSDSLPVSAACDLASISYLIVATVTDHRPRPSIGHREAALDSGCHPNCCLSFRRIVDRTTVRLHDGQRFTASPAQSSGFGANYRHSNRGRRFRIVENYSSFAFAGAGQCRVRYRSIAAGLALDVQPIVSSSYC